MKQPRLIIMCLLILLVQACSKDTKKVTQVTPTGNDSDTTVVTPPFWKKYNDSIPGNWTWKRTYFNGVNGQGTPSDTTFSVSLVDDSTFSFYGGYEATHSDNFRAMMAALGNDFYPQNLDTAHSIIYYDPQSLQHGYNYSYLAFNYVTDSLYVTITSNAASGTMGAWFATKVTH